MSELQKELLMLRSGILGKCDYEFLLREELISQEAYNIIMSERSAEEVRRGTYYGYGKLRTALMKYREDCNG